MRIGRVSHMRRIVGVVRKRTVAERKKRQKNRIIESRTAIMESWTRNSYHESGCQYSGA